MPVYPARSPGSQTKAGDSPVATRRPAHGVSSLSSRNDPSVAGADAAKRSPSKLVATRKMPSTSSPKKSSSSAPSRSTEDPSTPHSPHLAFDVGTGSPQQTSSSLASRFASFATETPSFRTPAQGFFPSTPTGRHETPGAVATVDAMREALRQASVRLRESDSNLSESLSIAAMARLELDGVATERDGLLSMNATLRERIAEMEKDVASARDDVRAARNEAREAQASAARVKLESDRRDAERGRTREETLLRKDEAMERVTREATAMRMEGELASRRVEEACASKIQHANREAEERISACEREVESAKRSSRRVAEDSRASLEESRERYEARERIHARDLESCRGEAERAKEALETFRMRIVDLERQVENGARASRNADLEKETAAATARRDVSDALDAQIFAEKKAAQLESALQETADARDAFRTRLETTSKSLETTAATANASRAERAEARAETAALVSRVAIHEKNAQKVKDLLLSVESKFRAVEAARLSRDETLAARKGTERATLRLESLRSRLDAELESRRASATRVFASEDALGAKRLEVFELNAALERWHSAVLERDAALDAMRLRSRDYESDVEASRLDALEARRAAAAAEGRARVAAESSEREIARLASRSSIEGKESVPERNVLGGGALGSSSLGRRAARETFKTDSSPTTRTAAPDVGRPGRRLGFGGVSDGSRSFSRRGGSFGLEVRSRDPPAPSVFDEATLAAAFGARADAAGRDARREGR